MPSNDAFGEDVDNSTSLDFAEIKDLGVLRSSPSSSSRFSQIIDKFVERALKKQPHGAKGYNVAIEYLSDLSTAMKNSHEFSLEQATTAHDLMVDGWCKHVVEVLGQTLRTFDQLRAVLDDIVNFAELKDGVNPPRTIQLALHHAINSIDWGAPATPHSNLDDLFIEDRPTRQTMTQDETTDAEDEIPDHGRHTSAGSPAGAQAPKTGRFSCSERFFKHHAMREKKAVSTDEWSDSERQPVKSECKAEWNRMDMRTQADWQDLFARWKQGDMSMEKPAATAHLFRDGISTNVWSGVNMASPAAVSKKRKAEAVEADRDEKPPVRPVALPSPPSTSSPAIGSKKGKADTASTSSDAQPQIDPDAILPTAEIYHSIPDPQRTCFLSAEFGKTTPFKIAGACKSALIARHGKSINLTWDEYERAHSTMFLIRWHDVKTARLFEGITVKGGSFETRAQAYPVTAPSIFIAQVSHQGVQGLRTDSIHGSILRILPQTEFHLRHEKIEPKSVVTAWMAVFSEPPAALHFTTAVQTKDGKEGAVTFEPLMQSAACPVCRQGHSAVECDLLEKAGRKELGLKKDSPGYLSKMPKLE